MKRRKVRQEKALARENRRAILEMALGGLPVLIMFLIVLSVPPRMSPEQLADAVKAQAIYKRLPDSRDALPGSQPTADSVVAEPALPTVGNTVQTTHNPKFLNVGFEQLSAFPFTVTRQMVNEKSAALSASSETMSQIPADVKALNDQDVCVSGFMLPIKFEGRLTTEFLLLRNQGLCCFGMPPKITEWINVRVAGKGVKEVMDEPVAVFGTLHVGDVRQNGDLVGIYRLDAKNIKLPGQ